MAGAYLRDPLASSAQNILKMIGDAQREVHEKSRPDEKN
jgi:hypothetical protein